ncbi:MAG: hypothetical protein K2N87_01760 [Eubacterium sp.]|nr:hypothetical protein [Eubacterium sp.]
MNVIFGNFYNPAYEDEAFVDEAMQFIKELGFNSVMFDTKAWEDFKERYDTGACSQYVKMQEYMGKSARAHRLGYNFLLLYLNGDNLYPHIRFSPPIYGEETVHADGTPGKWYKYWSPKARLSMKEHVERIMEMYGKGCERCIAAPPQSPGQEVIPVCSMWDPVVAPSFDREGIQRYQEFLRTLYGGDIAKLNHAYGTSVEDFAKLEPEEYWYALKYGVGFLTEEDVKKQTPQFFRWRDQAFWKARELELYFQEMQALLKEKNPELYLCPDLSQWGYFLNIYGRTQADADNEFSDLWDTAARGIDLYALAPFVDCCHFITVPVTPDGYPNAYVVSCQHSMMRVMNAGRQLIGGIYWGRFIYNDLYAFLTPAEMIGTMTACGMDGYTCYGINGLDDGGVLNRMEPSFLDSLALGNRWCAQVIPQRKGARKKEIALLFPSEMALLEPFETGNNKIRRLDLLGWYELCCDLGYQADVISTHQIIENALLEYRVLIVPANDCYSAAEHPQAEKRIREWVRAGGVLIHGPGDLLAAACFGIAGEACEKMPYQYGKTIIPQGESFCRYYGGKSVADYIDGGGCCVAEYAKDILAEQAAELAGKNEEPKKGAADWRGAVYSFGIQIGASYAAKNIPHVPYGQGNKEMYPLIQSKTTLVKDILRKYLIPASGICERGIETGVFENGMVIVNHRSEPYVLPENYQAYLYQYPPCRQDKKEVLAGHSAVWVRHCK